MKRKREPQKTSSVIHQELFEDESVLWRGQPDPVHMARRNLKKALFGILFAIIVVMMLNVLPTRSILAGGFRFYPIFAALIAFVRFVLLVFLGIGIWMIGAPVRNYIFALFTYYAVTNRRALIVYALFSKVAQSFTEQDFEFIRRISYPDGAGDIIFACETSASIFFDDQDRLRALYRECSERHIGAGMRPVGFLGIRDADYVEEILLQTFKSWTPREKTKRNSASFSGPHSAGRDELAKPDADDAGLLWHDNARFSQGKNQAHELTPGQWALLESLVRNSEGHVSDFALTGDYKILRDRGYITIRETGPGGRYMVITASNAGKRAVEKRSDDDG